MKLKFGGFFKCYDSFINAYITTRQNVKQNKFPDITLFASMYEHKGYSSAEKIMVYIHEVSPEFWGLCGSIHTDVMSNHNP